MFEVGPVTMPGPPHALLVLWLLARPATPLTFAPEPGKLAVVREEKAASNIICALLTEEAGLSAFQQGAGMCRMGLQQESQGLVKMVWTACGKRNILCTVFPQPRLS